MPAIFHLRGLLALALAKLGFRIFPLIPGGKTPAIENWPDRATTDETIIRQWWSIKDYNIGLVTGPYSRVNGGSAMTYWLVVVDYDMKDGQQGGNALLRHELFGLSDTKTSKTPNGIHKFYWASVAIPNSLSRIAPNVDVRGTRGYVVAPGSTIKDVTYQWIGEFTEPAPFPEEFQKLALKPTDTGKLDQKTHRKAPIGELDRPDSIERARLYVVNEAPEAIEGSHGDETTYRVAAYVKDLGVSEPVCFELLQSFWNEEKAIPPWSYDELRTKVSNAYRYGQNAPGSADPLNEFGDGNSGPSGQTARQTDAKGREPMVDESFDHAADTALDNQANPLIEGILGQGEISAIYGYPDSGKTFVALDICYAIATGTPWNGCKVTQGAVLYVAAEGGHTIRKRFRALRTKYGKKNVPLWLLRYPIDMRTGNYDAVRLCQLIKDREQELGIKFLMVVIDTLSEALAGGNDVDDMPQFIHNAQIIKNKTRANVMVIHHPGKDMAKGPRGWSGFRGWVDTLIEVHDPNQGRRGSRRKFTILRLRDGEIPALPMWFQLEIMDLGETANGVKVTSTVVVWCDSASEEFKTEMTPDEAALYATIERWAEITEQAADDVGAAGLRVWIERNEPDNPIKEIKDATLRKQIQRLRDKGYLALLTTPNKT